MELATTASDVKDDMCMAFVSDIEDGIVTMIELVRQAPDTNYVQIINTLVQEGLAEAEEDEVL